MPVASAATISRARSSSARRPPASTSTGAPSSTTRAQRRVGSRLSGRSIRTPGASAVDHHGVVTRGEDEHVRLAPAEDGRRGAAGLSLPHGDVGGQPDAAEAGAVGQAGNQARGDLSRRSGLE